jgi:glutathione synthase/RimK-type ligase-like ATP-grasp enzyme
MKIRLEPYKLWSGGAKRLGLRAGILRATQRQVDKHGDFDYIINWGSSEKRFGGQYINDPTAVAVSSDKLETAKVLGNFGVAQPPYTTDREVAQQWLTEGHSVLARTLLRASSGRGITLVSPDGDTELPKAPLYTMYIPKTTEYRIHVLGDKVIDTQEKKRSTEVDDDKVNWQIRNNCNGFIFARCDVVAPTCVTDNAVRAVSALGLDFGAVDIGYNTKRDKCRVYEVNTAPGLEGSTLDMYYAAFMETLPALKSGAYKRRRADVDTVESSREVA